MGVQVQSATKNGQGESLSILNRQFISFSYGGKNIEDFDLLAVFSNDRLDKEIYAPFNDTTTEQAELDGQMFWRSNFKAGQLNFTLATDGMTARQLEDFKEWFKPGIERELILSEYHNRAILARVSSAPHISLLPFEKEVNVQIGNTSYPTKTSLYKGEIKLDFVMDDPYWYSINTCVDSINEESLKLIYEDGIPHLDMFKTSCFLPNNEYISIEQVKIEGEDGEEPSYRDEISKIKNSGITLSKADNTNLYLYYCGTAAEKPIVSFSIQPELKENKFVFPGLNELELAFLNLNIEAEDYLRMSFSLPSLLSSYNNAIDIVSKYESGSSILEIRKELRDYVYNYYTRSYVIAVIDYAKNNKTGVDDSGKITENFITFFLTQMKNFFVGPLACIINCKNGEVTVETKINLYIGGTIEEDNDYIPSEQKTIIENAGNMIKSNYLTIETRKLPKNGLITENECFLITTNSKLTNFKIDYKYKYL